MKCDWNLDREEQRRCSRRAPRTEARSGNNHAVVGKQRDKRAWPYGWGLPSDEVQWMMEAEESRLFLSPGKREIEWSLSLPEAMQWEQRVREFDEGGSGREMGGGKFSWESHCYSPGEEGQKPRLGWVASLIGYEGSKAISALLRGMLLWSLNAEREEALGWAVLAIIV